MSVLWLNMGSISLAMCSQDVIRSASLDIQMNIYLVVVDAFDFPAQIAVSI